MHEEAVSILKSGGVILYPSDTIWGIGCDATNPIAVSKLYEIKRRKESKALITLVANEKQLKKYTNIKVKKISNNPTTIIYPKIKGLAKNLIAIDGSAAIRIVQDDFCKKLILQTDKPLVSTSANISGEKQPNKFSEITKDIINNVDYIIDFRKEEIMQNPSTIIKVNDYGVIIKKIRQ